MFTFQYGHKEFGGIHSLYML